MTVGHNPRQQTTRRRFLSTVGVTAFAGCLGQPSPLNNQGQAQEDSTSDIPTAEPPGPLRFSLDEVKESAVQSSADTDEIPAIDTPKFTDADAGDEYLEPDDVVFGVTVNGQAKAYPQPILVWHEIVNDSIAGRKFAVTYCPLTGTAIGYERGDTKFGVEGWLVNSNLILFDRETHSWWPQVLGTAVSGAYKGSGLGQIPVIWTRWNRWKTDHPDTTVLTTDTGYIRNYQDDPFGWYSTQDSNSPEEVLPSQSEFEMLNYYQASTLYYPVMTEDSRFTSKHVVIGARTPDATAAVSKTELIDNEIITTDLDGEEIIGVYNKKLDTGQFYRNPDRFSVQPAENNSLIIEGTQYPVQKVPLPPVDSFEAMWFAWNAFYPHSTIIE